MIHFTCPICNSREIYLCCLGYFYKHLEGFKSALSCLSENGIKIPTEIEKFYEGYLNDYWVARADIEEEEFKKRREKLNKRRRKNEKSCP